LVFFALRVILAPNLAFVNFNLARFFISGAAKHCPMFETMRPAREPELHLNLRTTLLPRFAQAIFSSSVTSLIFTTF
jgi:hypothetical protein